MPSLKHSYREIWRRLLSHETRVILAVLAAGLPAVAVSLVFLWADDHDATIRWTLTSALIVAWLGFALAARRLVVFQLRTLSNFLHTVAEGDYGVRIRTFRESGALCEVVREANALGDVLRERRLDAIEASGLLQQVMAEIDVAVFAFGPDDRLSLLNPQAERLFGQTSELMLGRSAEELRVSDFLRGDVPRIVEPTMLGGAGRWELRRATFREKGLQHQLIVLSDLTRTLHEEERRAWRRLVRILQHEINNSLAPISSLAGTLGALVRREPRPEDWQEDLVKGLEVIAHRSDALNRFMVSYARLTKVPKPQLGPVRVSSWIERVVSLEGNAPAIVTPGPDVTIQADSDQMDQLLINLVRNASDAVSGTSGSIKIGWGVFGRLLEVWIEDEGPGLPDTSNLFVPFFTTKPNGTGIGLVISRQIAETHEGTLLLENMSGGRGCRATVRLPVS